MGWTYDAAYIETRDPYKEIYENNYLVSYLLQCRQIGSYQPPEINSY